MRCKIVTRGKPFQSKLAPYEAEIKELKASGASIRAITAEMASRHGLTVSHNAVASFMKTHGLSHKSFLDGISQTRKIRPISGYGQKIAVKGDIFADDSELWENA